MPERLPDKSVKPQFPEGYDKVSGQAKKDIDNKYPCGGGRIRFRVTDGASYTDIVKIME